MHRKIHLGLINALSHMSFVINKEILLFEVVAGLFYILVIIHSLHWTILFPMSLHNKRERERELKLWIESFGHNGGMNDFDIVQGTFCL